MDMCLQIDMPKRNSDAWTFFERDESKKKATCTLCGKTYSTGGGTSNLFDHLRRSHTESSSRAVKSYTVGIMYGEDNKEKKKLDVALKKFLLSNLLSFSIVENEEFKAFVKLLCPRYPLPDHRALSTDIIQQSFKNVKDAIFADLMQTTCMALTTDTWKSNRQDSYFALTAHFILTEKLVSVCLECCVVKEPFTADSIAEKIKDIMIKWNIEGKVTAIVTDNSTNMVNAVSSMSIQHVPCVSHAINLVFVEAMKNTSGLAVILNHCSDIVTFFRHSNTASGTLACLQEAAGKEKLCLVQQTVTRWNSKLAMLYRLLEVREELIIAQSNIVNAPPVLTDQEWKIVEELIQITKPFHTMTTALSKEQYVTCSHIIPLVHGLILEVSEIGSKLTMEVSKNFLKSIVNSLKNHLFPYESWSVPRLATFFDPRFKKVGFRLSDCAEEAQKQAESKIDGFLKGKEQMHLTFHESEEPTAGPSYVGLLSFLTQKSGRCKTELMASTDAAAGIQQYIEDPLEPQTADPLKYWIHSNRVAGLCDVAMWYLCVPASSVPAERIFSKAGQIISEKRNLLNPENAEVLIFLNGNKQYIQ